MKMRTNPVTLLTEEGTGTCDKLVELVVMYPVSRTLDVDDPDILEILCAAVVFRVGGPAFGAPKQQRRTGYAAIQGVLLRLRQADRGKART